MEAIETREDKSMPAHFILELLDLDVASSGARSGDNKDGRKMFTVRLLCREIIKRECKLTFAS